MRYYDLVGNWYKVQPHLKDEAVLKALQNGMDDLLSRWGKKFDTIKVPRDYEWANWDWEFDEVHEYWDYTLFNACFWLVDFNYELAKLVEPDESWQIIRSDKHATVWNGKDLLFEFNLMAFGWTADACYELSCEKYPKG